jgi:hypothetical protein
MTNKIMIMLKKRGFNFIPLFMLLIFLFNAGYTKAQVITPQQVLAEVYNSYDNLQFLSFDVKYTYTSDTVNGDFVYDVLEGSYTLAGSKAKFNIGDIEFMQNDSFFITVYKNDKIILVADPRNANTGKELPMRQVMDSLVNTLSHYNVQVGGIEDTVIVDLTAVDDVAQFLKFSLSYDTVQKVLYKIEYVFEEPFLQSDTVIISSVPLPATRTKRFKVEFLHYRFDNFSESVYDENQYIYFENGECKPVEKFIDFRLFYSRTGKLITEPTNNE